MKNKFKSMTINSLWIMIGRMFQLGLTFITTMLVARYLGPDNYGKITYTYSFVVFFIPFCSLGLNDIIVKQLIDNQDKNEEILGTTLVLRVVSSILSIIFVTMLLSIIEDEKILITLTFLQSLSLLFQVFDSIAYWYHSKLASKAVGFAYIFAYTLSTVFRFLCIYLKFDVRYFAFAVSLDFALISIFLIVCYLSSGKRFYFSFNCAKSLLSKSWHYIFASLMVTIYGRADTIILGKMLDDATVGFYSAATMICGAWPFVLSAIIDSFNPSIIKDATQKEVFNKKVKQLYAMVFYISLFVGLILALGSDIIINILFGPEYAPASIVLKIVPISTIFSYLGVARTAWIQCNNKQKYEKILAFLGAVSNLLLNIILIKLFGMIGAAITFSLTQFLTNFIYPLLIKETRENSLLIIDAIILKDVFK